MKFEEYANQIRMEKERKRMEKLNGLLAKGIRERTHAEAVRALYCGLTFVGRISDFTAVESARTGKELVF